MSEVSIVTAAAEKIRAAFYPFYHDNHIGKEIPKSLGDEIVFLMTVKTVQSKEMAIAQMGAWLAKGWVLYKAAALGILPNSTRFQGLAPGESRVFIEDDAMCHRIQRAFKETIVPPAKELLTLGAAVPMSKDVRDYLGK